jgi:hypothetical protein
MRREQRDISKRDLQKAIKYGTRQSNWGGRWKIEYDGIIFITNNSMRKEITAFPSPLQLAPVDSEAHLMHMKAKEIMKHKPELCASHTVLVVDNSGSMATHDISLHRDRQVAAYSVTAAEYIAEQLFTGTANNSDVVSLVEFRQEAKVVFSREPVSWALYNKLRSRRDERNYVSRESHRGSDVVDSNYLPALDAAEKLLSKDDHDLCALSLLFLSDGAPSDGNNLRLTPTAANTRICDRIIKIATMFVGRLEIKLIGFGNELDDFSVLEAMAKVVTDTPGDTRAEFVYCEKMAHNMATAVSSLATSLANTRTALLRDGGWSRTKRNVEAERDPRIYNDWKFFRITDHRVYNPATRTLVGYPGLPPGALRDDNMDLARARARSPPPFLALNTKHCGIGAERLAFRCQLSDKMQVDGFAFATMVAKETNLVERIEENIEFHRKFCETQNLAAHLADEFNQRLQAIPGYDERTTPRISFLACSVLVLDDENWSGRQRGVLVERMLDTNRHAWCKWNDNAGGIEGQAAHFPLDVDREYANLSRKPELLGEILEGSEDESDEESIGSAASSMGEETHEEYIGEVKDLHECNYKNGLGAKPADYLQAFAHFSYRCTNSKLLVCDLQGIYDDTAVPPLFELTDPAIHYSSSRGREMVYGRTDKGKAGIQLFFKTHKCTQICKLMQLSKKNKNWRKDWHRRHEDNFQMHG